MDKQATIAKANALISEGSKLDAKTLLINEGILEGPGNDAIIARMAMRIGEVYNKHRPIVDGSKNLIRNKRRNTFLSRCMDIFRENPNASSTDVCRQVGCSIDQAMRARDRLEHERKLGAIRNKASREGKTEI